MSVALPGAPAPSRPDSGIAGGSEPLAAVEQDLHRVVVEACLGGEPVGLEQIGELVRQRAPLLSPQLQERLAERVSARLGGLGPLESLVTDDAVNEIMVNGAGAVWVEESGTLRRTAVLVGESTLHQLIERVVAPLGLRADRTSPLVDARLPDGSRVNVVMPPVAVDGPYLIIRRFRAYDLQLEDFAPPPVAALLRWMVLGRANIVVSGGTGAGKTTFLNTLAAHIPANQRIVTVEDAAELNLEATHVVRLESRPSSVEGLAAVTVRDLVRNALRMRPDRILVGEVRGAEAFDMLVEANLSLLPAEFAGYLHVLFSADALAAGGLIEGILERSADFASDLAVRLRERVYFKTVPALASALARRLGHEATPSHLDDAYEQVMVILFRLLFVAYAEDKDLLPYRTNSHYADHSLKLRARRLTEDRRAGQADYDESATDLWDDVRQLWRAVDTGNSGWGVPAYNGGLFSHDPDVSPAGAALATLQLTDDEFAPALSALLVDEGDEGYGPVDFRLLSVREFGTIYEGLLESTLAVAQDDLAVRKVKGQEQYVPAKADEAVEVPAGAAYLHNRSGVRKATGSYFTKPFAVEHLLEHALKPALDDHISRLDALSATGDDASLAEAFFDFRCADVAMGSGHFLVAALDRIEARLSAWLAQHPVPGVSAELDRLRDTALAALGDLGVGVEIESTSLLRRQVARHCVYGVDRNRVAVELARLSIWVHTFVPGLPLSLLDHNLICGDSLTGVGTLDEAVAAIDPAVTPEEPSLFRDQIIGLLARAEDALRRLARTSDATKKEIDEARDAHRSAQTAVVDARAIFDVITAQRAGACKMPAHFDVATFVEMAKQPEVADKIRDLRPVHFPADFPEIFLRDNPGFDCLVGNPPWEQVVVQEHVWWGTHLPGIRGQPINQMNDAILGFRLGRPDLDTAFDQAVSEAEAMRAVLRNAFPALGAGHTDLYKAFAWRNWQLIRRQSGIVGIVLPRTALQSKGSEQWRKTVLNEGTFSDVTVLLNTAGWVFDDVDGRYTVGLCSLRKGTDHAGTLRLSGPYSSWPTYRARQESGIESIPTDEFITWSDDASFPQLPAHPGSLRLFRKLRMHDRLDGRRVLGGGTGQRSSSIMASPAPAGRPQRDQRQAPLHPRRWRVRPLAELHATADKHRFILDGGIAARTENSTRPMTNTGSSSTRDTLP